MEARTYLCIPEQVIVYFNDRGAHLVVVLTLRAMALLQLVAHQTDLHNLDPLFTNSLSLPLLVGCDMSTS